MVSHFGGAKKREEEERRREKVEKEEEEKEEMNGDNLSMDGYHFVWKLFLYGYYGFVWIVMVLYGY